MKRPVIYVPQEPMRKDKDGNWVPKGSIDLSPSSEYGDLFFIWETTDSELLDREALEEDALWAAKRYDEKRDYMMALGSPTLIGIFGWALGTLGKRVRMLEWDKGMERYVVKIVDNLERVTNEQEQNSTVARGDRIV